MFRKRWALLRISDNGEFIHNGPATELPNRLTRGHELTVIGAVGRRETAEG